MFGDHVKKKRIKCCDIQLIENQRLKDIDVVNFDDPTRDEDRKNCQMLKVLQIKIKTI